MATRITTRSLTTTSVTSDNLNKGSALTHSELDSNFINIKNNKLENTDDDFTGTLSLKGSGSSATGAFRMHDNDDSHYVDLKAPATIATNFSLVLPVDDGTSGQVLTTDGSGNLSFTDKTALTGLDIDGFTDGTSITLAATDKFLISDDDASDAEKKINASQVLDYIETGITMTGNFTSTAGSTALGATTLSGTVNAGGQIFQNIGEFELQGTDTELRGVLASAKTLTVGETITQATSGATGVVRYGGVSSTTLYLDSVTGTFDTSNTLTGSTSGALSTTLASITFQRANFGTTISATSDTPQFISITDLTGTDHDGGNKRQRSGLAFQHKFDDQTDSLGDFSFQQRDDGNHRFDIRLHSYSAGPRADALSYDFKAMFHARNTDRVNIDPTDANPSSGNPAISVRTSDIRIDHALVPTGDNSLALGSASKRFSTLHSGALNTGDINMSNMDHETGNEVDGTQGSWTLQEGAEHLYIINRNSGKKYRFCLTEIE